MRRLLQNARHDDVPYDRPNLPWVCGKAAEGCPCAAGPTARGRCPDNACRPQRSLRVRRGRIAVGVALFSVGLAMVLIGSPWKDRALAPGPLSQAHARLLSADRNPNRCAACHPGGANFALGLASPELASAAAAGATQSDLCLNCHQTLIDPKHALTAHGLPAGSLDSKRRGGGVAIEASLTGGLSSMSRMLGAASDEPLACAACHQEHHGAGHNLSFISDGRCQACHSQRFDSFAGSHPGFGNWPYRRRTRINFDHNSHAAKHFAEKNQAFDCAACHLDSPGRDDKLLAHYDQACAACHDEGIKAGAPAGLALFSLPTLDRNAIEAAGESLGAWPEQAIGDFDGELSAVATLLLATDADGKAVLDRLGANVSLFDLDPDSPDDARLAKQLADALRRLLNGLSVNGHAEVVQRTAPLGPATIDLAGGLPVTAVDAALRRWFTGLEQPRSPATVKQLADRQTGGGWFVDDDRLAIRYVPRGHADPLLRAWIDLAAGMTDEHAELRDAAMAELASATSPGRCVVCHSVDDAATVDADTMTVNWRGLRRDELPRPFTKFSHRPHTTQPELADCTHCHRLDTTADRQGAPYPSTRLDDFVCQFEPIEKADCAQCHKPAAAGNRCTQCHNYHVGEGF